MQRPIRRTIVLLMPALLASGALSTAPASASPVALQDATSSYAAVFDEHWERLRDGYPYFELYGIDWEAERAQHRPKAIAAANADEFAWEMGRLFAVLPDAHVSFLPAIDTMAGRWSYPEVESEMIGRRAYLLEWPEGTQPEPPPAFAKRARAYPEILSVEGVPPYGAGQVLSAGPLGTSCTVRLRWPDGSESEHEFQQPQTSNLPPKKQHFGEGWLVTGRVGSIGYMWVRTFSPERATLGPDGKMTTMLRAALAELRDTAGLVLDLQGNGGGRVAASDPFLGNLIERSLSYRWGGSGGKRRVIRPRTPRYRGEIVAIVDRDSASGGEWAARILRDAGRATVVGEQTSGAEAAIHTSTGQDGSVVKYSAWPMVEPGVTPFQETGIELDHDFPLTIEAARSLGFEEARARARRARFAKALELLGAPASELDALVALPDAAQAALSD